MSYSWLPQNYPDDHRNAFPRLIFGGERYDSRRREDLQRALVIDALCLLLLMLGWAATTRGNFARGATPAQQQEQSQSQSQTTGSATPRQPAPVPDGTKKDTSAADKPAADKTRKKRVFTEEDLSSLKGGVSVVGEGNARGDSAIASSASGSGRARSADEQSWRDRAAQIHQQIDSIEEQIKALKEDIKKNGGSSFDAQSGLQENRVYIIDKNAKVDSLEKRKKALEQKLEDLQEEARKAGVPSDWVR
jgi:DNA repair exonuclease SbcCD ATPase subunit